MLKQLCAETIVFLYDLFWVQMSNQHPGADHTLWHF